jgi:putative flavoprotein involved in K+ transport
LTRTLDVVVIGGGQAGLALGFYLRRTSLSHVILDAQSEPGGAWLHTWRSLRLFSPARFSSLPGWVMPGGPDYYPTRDEALAYLRGYEERYAIPVERPARVREVRRDGEPHEGGGDVPRAEGAGVPRGDRSNTAREVHGGGGELVLECTDGRTWRARAVVSATGTWEAPIVPELPGRSEFEGVQLHSGSYVTPEPFTGRRVLVVGGGNSGAQIQAELSRVASSTWVTLAEPRFLPDHVDGRYLFDEATAWWSAQQEGSTWERPSLGDIVMVPEVREARARGALASVRPFLRMTRTGVVWADGREEPVDAVIWATGFGPALSHLRALGVIEADGRVRVERNRSRVERRLWLVGYGNWTGFASATLIAVGRSARSVVGEISEALSTKG